MATRPNRSELWARFGDMSKDEVWTRARQEMGKRVDAVLYWLRIPLWLPGLKRATEMPARFFFERGELGQIAALLSDRLPAEAAQIVTYAEQICQHRFNLLGYQAVDYGPKIDWNFDAVNRKRAPHRLWYKVPYLDFNESGDHKVIWELNRHQHLVTLAKAYCLTGDERYATEVLQQWSDWQVQNPYPLGINWASSLEVAFRSLSWLWAKYLLSGSPMLPDSFQTALVRALGVNGRHIERYLSTYFSPNTHLLGEGVGLFFIGTLCPELADAGRWQEHGWQIVLREAGRQVRTDGLHFEQSAYYHVYALDFFLHARTLAARNQILIPAAFDQKLEKMLEVLRVLAQAGPPPSFGDDDGGRVFNPGRNRAEHLLDPLASGAVIYDRREFKAAARDIHEETLWLLGPSALARFEGIPAVAPVLVSAGFESSGLYVMSDSKPSPQQMVIDAGPQGSDTGGHAHADALAIQLAINGREWLVDAGTFCYVSDAKERNRFRGTGAHNTLQVDGFDQADPAGPFAWHSLPAVHTDCWVAGKTFDLFAGRHTGYARLSRPVIHRRWVFGLKSQFWLVRDLAEGEGPHSLELFWRVAPGSHAVGAESDANTIFRFQSNEEGLAFVAVRDHEWSRDIAQGENSPVFGKKVAGPVLRFSTRTALPAEFVVLLVPLTAESPNPGLLERLELGVRGAGVRGYRYTCPESYHYIFFAEHGQRWELRPWASDAQFMYCGITQEGKQHLVLCGGSYAEIGGARALSLKRPVAHFEYVRSGNQAQIFSSDESALNHLSEDALACTEAVLSG